MNGMIRCSCLMFCNPPSPSQPVRPSIPQTPCNSFGKFSSPWCLSGFSFTCFTLLQLSPTVHLFIFGAVSVLISRLGFTKILISFVFAGGITLPPRVIHK